MYDGCPITWGSKLQTVISLSATESDYVSLSSAMREVIPFLGIMKETAGLFGLLTRDPLFRCFVRGVNFGIFATVMQLSLSSQTV